MSLYWSRVQREWTSKAQEWEPGSFPERPSRHTFRRNSRRLASTFFEGVCLWSDRGSVIRPSCRVHTDGVEGEFRCWLPTKGGVDEGTAVDDSLGVMDPVDWS